MTGTFDNWSKSYPLVKQTDGSFELNVPLDRSKEILYKYVVDGEWTTSKDQATTSDSSGNTNNVLEPVKGKEYKGTSSLIPEAGGIGAAGAAASSGSKDKELKSTVLPSSEGKQTTLGEPGIFVPQAKDTEALAAFTNVRDVDPKTLNEPNDKEAFTKELTPEEKKKHKKKLKKTQYRLRKKQQKQAASGAAAGGAAGAAGGASNDLTTGEDNDQSYASEDEQTPEPEDTEAAVTGTILGAVGGAATAGAGGALVGALGGASAAHAFSHHHSEDASTATPPEEKEVPPTLDPGRQGQLNIPGSISGVDRVPTRDDDLATKTKTIDTLTSSEYVDTQDGETPAGPSSGAVGATAVGVIPEDKHAEDVSQDGLAKQKENTESYPVKGDLTQAGAAAVPVTAVYEDKSKDALDKPEDALDKPKDALDKPKDALDEPKDSLEKQKENTESYPVEEDLTKAGAAAVPVTAVYEDKAQTEPSQSEKLDKNIEDEAKKPEVEEKKPEDEDKNNGAGIVGAAAAGGVAGGATGAAVGGASAAPAKETLEPSVPVHSVTEDQAPPAAKSAVPQTEAPVASKDGSEVPGVFGSGSAVTPEVGPKEVPQEVSAKEVDAAPVTKGDHKYDSEDEIIIAQGGESVKQVEKRIHEWEGDDVSVEQIQPSPSEARRLAEEAHLLKQAQIAAEKGQEVASPTKPASGPAKLEKKPVKKAEKPPNAAQQLATKTKKGILSKLKKIFK